MRLIDADALMKTLGITDMDCGKCKWGDHGYCTRGSDFVDACTAIEDAPTIEERKTGKWIRKISVVDCATFVGDECSQCGYFKSMGQANFCPDCGVDMRGGEPHETP